MPWLLDELPTEDAGLSGAAREAAALLSQRGACFLPEIVAGTHRLPVEVEDALWQLAAAGLATADGFWPLRGRLRGAQRRAQRTLRSGHRSRPRLFTTRWSLLKAFSPLEGISEARATQLLRRYGIVFPELLSREPLAPPWRILLRIYRRAEARGEIRGGRFVAGFMGEQFALPEAVEMLRSLRKVEPDGEVTVISACDPLNVAGVLTPGPRVPAVPGNRLAFRDGVPVASLQGGEFKLQAGLDEAIQAEVRELLGPRHKEKPLSHGNRIASLLSPALR